MAVVRVEYFSQCLHKTVQMAVVLPVDRRELKEAKIPEAEEPYKTLYLLHGICGSCSSWLYNVPLESLAEEKNIAIVMPDGHNRYYIDNPLTDERHGEMVGKEIVEFTRKLFHLSDKREDTCIGGFSMGGYGAFRNGLKYSETFGRIISLAGGFRYKHMDRMAGGVFAESLSFFEAVYGDLSKIKGNLDIDLEARVIKMKEDKIPFPEIYLAVGTEDPLLEDERVFRKFLNEQQVNLTYEEGKGAHEWNFVNTYIKKALDWWIPE